jgi:hypothetical protein
LTRRRDFSKLAKADLNQAEDIFPARFFASSRPAIAESDVNIVNIKTKENTYAPREI